MANKIKHLEFIQAVITRMSTNSFLIKGWCVTLVAALIALAQKDAETTFVVLAYLPVLMFWILDAFFLWQERLFRRLYDHVRQITEDANVDFSMNTAPFAKDVQSWARVGFSRTLLLFYLTLSGAILLVMTLILQRPS